MNSGVSSWNFMPTNLLSGGDHSHQKPSAEDAYEYSQQVLVGNALPIQNKKTAPNLEKSQIHFGGKRQRLFLFSGTASIKGEMTWALAM